MAVGDKLNEAEARADAERAPEPFVEAERNLKDDPMIDGMARVALAVLQADGHAHGVMNNSNPLTELREMVARRLNDPPAASADGAERFVHAVVDAMRQLRPR